MYLHILSHRMRNSEIIFVTELYFSKLLQKTIEMLMKLWELLNIKQINTRLSYNHYMKLINANILKIFNIQILWTNSFNNSYH